MSSPCSREISIQCSRRRRIGGDRSQTWKWYQKNQNLEVKTESRSLIIELGRPWWAVSDYKVYKNLRKPGCIDHLRRLGMYHLCKPVDDDEDRIVGRVLPISRHRQSRTSRDSCQPADDNKDQIVTGKLPIGSGNCRSP